MTSVPCGCVRTRGQVWVEQEPGPEGTRGCVTYSQCGSDPCLCLPLPHPVPAPRSQRALSLSPHMRCFYRRDPGRYAAPSRGRAASAPHAPSLPPCLPASLLPQFLWAGTEWGQVRPGVLARAGLADGVQASSWPPWQRTFRDGGEALPRPPAGSWGRPASRPSARGVQALGGWCWGPLRPSGSTSVGWSRAEEERQGSGPRPAHSKLERGSGGASELKRPVGLRPKVGGRHQTNQGPCVQMSK